MDATRRQVQDSTKTGWLTSRLSLLLVLAGFVISRIGARLAGVRFDMQPLGEFWQYLDPVLLRENLLQSVYYLHSQPPLFNLVLGAALKLFPGRESAAFQMMFLLMGLGLCFGLWALILRLTRSAHLSLWLTLLFCASPAAILYENHLFYTYPLALTLTTAALCVCRWATHRRLIDLAVLLGCLRILVWTRSMFHIAWMALIIVGLGRLVRPPRRFYPLAALALLIGLAPYVKNAVEFGSFSTSSWFGMSLARLTTWKIGPEERRRLAIDLKISEVSLYNPYRPLDRYVVGAGFPPAPPTGVSALDQSHKSTGENNFNNLTYVAISRAYLRDALYVLPRYPGTYLTSLGEAFYTYFIPSSSFWFVRHNREHIRTLDRIYNFIVLGQFDYEGDLTQERRFFNIGLWSLLAYLLLTPWALRWAHIAWRRRPGLAPEALTLLFIAGNIVYVSLVANAFELGENNRFRFMIEPLVFALAAFAVSRRGRAHADPENDPDGGVPPAPDRNSPDD